MCRRVATFVGACPCRYGHKCNKHDHCVCTKHNMGHPKCDACRDILQLTHSSSDRAWSHKMRLGEEPPEVSFVDEAIACGCAICAKLRRKGGSQASTRPNTDSSNSSSSLAAAAADPVGVAEHHYEIAMIALNRMNCDLDYSDEQIEQAVMRQAAMYCYPSVRAWKETVTAWGPEKVNAMMALFLADPNQAGEATVDALLDFLRSTTVPYSRRTDTHPSVLLSGDVEENPGPPKSLADAEVALAAPPGAAMITWRDVTCWFLAILAMVPTTCIAILRATPWRLVFLYGIPMFTAACSTLYLERLLEVRTPCGVQLQQHANLSNSLQHELDGLRLHYQEDRKLWGDQLARAQAEYITLTNQVSLLTSKTDGLSEELAAQRVHYEERIANITVNHTEHVTSVIERYEKKLVKMSRTCEKNTDKLVESYELKLRQITDKAAAYEQQFATVSHRHEETVRNLAAKCIDQARQTPIAVTHTNQSKADVLGENKHPAGWLVAAAMQALAAWNARRKTMLLDATAAIMPYCALSLLAFEHAYGIALQWWAYIVVVACALLLAALARVCMPLLRLWYASLRKWVDQYRYGAWPQHAADLFVAQATAKRVRELIAALPSDTVPTSRCEACWKVACHMLHHEGAVPKVKGAVKHQCPCSDKGAVPVLLAQYLVYIRAQQPQPEAAGRRQKRKHLSDRYNVFASADDQQLVERDDDIYEDDLPRLNNTVQRSGDNRQIQPGEEAQEYETTGPQMSQVTRKNLDYLKQLWSQFPKDMPLIEAERALLAKDSKSVLDAMHSVSMWGRRLAGLVTEDESFDVKAPANNAYMLEMGSLLGFLHGTTNTGDVTVARDIAAFKQEMQRRNAELADFMEDFDHDFRHTTGLTKSHPLYEVLSSRGRRVILVHWFGPFETKISHQFDYADIFHTWKKERGVAGKRLMVDNLATSTSKKVVVAQPEPEAAPIASAASADDDAGKKVLFHDGTCFTKVSLDALPKLITDHVNKTVEENMARIMAVTAKLEPPAAERLDEAVSTTTHVNPVPESAVIGSSPTDLYKSAAYVQVLGEKSSVLFSCNAIAVKAPGGKTNNYVYIALPRHYIVDGELREPQLKITTVEERPADVNVWLFASAEMYTAKILKYVYTGPDEAWIKVDLVGSHDLLPKTRKFTSEKDLTQLREDLLKRNCFVNLVEGVWDHERKIPIFSVTPGVVTAVVNANNIHYSISTQNGTCRSLVYTNGGQILCGHWNGKGTSGYPGGSLVRPPPPSENLWPAHSNANAWDKRFFMDAMPQNAVPVPLPTYLGRLEGVPSFDQPQKCWPLRTDVQFGAIKVRHYMMRPSTEMNRREIMNYGGFIMPDCSDMPLQRAYDYLINVREKAIRTEYVRPDAEALRAVVSDLAKLTKSAGVFAAGDHQQYVLELGEGNVELGIDRVVSKLLTVIKYFHQEPLTTTEALEAQVFYEQSRYWKVFGKKDGYKAAKMEIGRTIQAPGFLMKCLYVAIMGEADQLWVGRLRRGLATWVFVGADMDQPVSECRKHVYNRARGCVSFDCSAFDRRLSRQLLRMFFQHERDTVGGAPVKFMEWLETITIDSRLVLSDATTYEKRLGNPSGYFDTIKLNCVCSALVWYSILLHIKDQQDPDTLDAAHLSRHYHLEVCGDDTRLWVLTEQACGWLGLPTADVALQMWKRYFPWAVKVEGVIKFDMDKSFQDRMLVAPPMVSRRFCPMVVMGKAYLFEPLVDVSRCLKKLVHDTNRTREEEAELVLSAYATLAPIIHQVQRGYVVSPSVTSFLHAFPDARLADVPRQRMVDLVTLQQNQVLPLQ